MQQEWDGLTDSCRNTLITLFPYILASLITSIALYFSRHFGKEPFKISIFIAKNLKAVFIGAIVGCFCKGMGISPWIGVGMASTIIARGIDWFFEILDSFVYMKLGIERRKNEHTGSSSGRNKHH